MLGKLVLVGLCAAAAAATSTPETIRFSPRAKYDPEGVWLGVQNMIKSASTSIDVAMYSMSVSIVFDSLLAAMLT